MFRVLSRFQKGIAFFMVFVFTASNNAWALTSGPAQPETQQFAPAGMDNMVDPFTGDFSYNIPLMDVGGYPLNINYAAGITPDQEASWVGLGWNLNVGAINRSVRGIADDFAGDEIRTEHSIRPNQTFGVTFSKSSELFTFQLKGQEGGVSASAGFNVSYNTYNGFGFSVSVNPSIEAPLSNKDSKFDLGLKAGLNLSLGSDGVGINPSAGLSHKEETNKESSTLNASIGFPYSSKEGAKGMSMSASFKNTGTEHVTKTKNGKTSSGDQTSGSGFGGSSFHGFSTPTYTTSVQHDMYAVNATLNLTPEKVGTAKDKGLITLGGYYSGQFQKNKSESNPAYGYLYEGLNGSDDALLDFNREKDGGFNKYTTNFPVTNHTYDIYSVSGEGVGGTYRIFRGDVGTVGDNVHSEEVVSPDLAVSGGIGESGATTNIKLGIDFTYGNSYTEAGRWSDSKVQNFVNPTNPINSANQTTYFGKIGEASPENSPSYYTNTLLRDYLYEYASSSGVLTGQHTPSNNITMAKGGAGYLRNQRRNRTNTFSYLTAEKASSHAIDKQIKSYSGFTTSTSPTPNIREQVIQYPSTSYNRVDNNRKGHHISEIRVTGDNGSRYVYGVPIYNKYQYDATFSVEASDRNTSRATGLVSYSSEDASTNNKKGLERYFNKTIVPASASSYLLSYILSSDYVDSDNIPGPSDGDLGTYVKFNYTRTSESYKWRTPYEAGMANYQDGLAGKSNDDKGSYSYGEKEIWYIHSIETRTHVAEFYTSPRLDGRGVQGEHGGISTTDANALMKLDKIVLYAKPDKRNGRNEPLKTVHFKYNYALCPGTPNSVNGADIRGAVNTTNGKLTLEKVWFTYGNSNKGILNPYEFSYDTETGYSSKNYDRWGLFKEQSQNLNGMNTEAYPYTIQNKTLADKYSAAYALNKIVTPTGGEMRIHYESDDYGYVQDKQAMRMFTLQGVSSSLSDENPTSQLYSDLNFDGRMFLHVNLGEGFNAASSSDAAEYIRNKYLQDLTELQYRIKVNILNDNQTAEYINGYCRFIKANVRAKSSAGNDHYDGAVIELEKESLNGGGNENMNPFVKNAWLYGRMHYSRELTGAGDATDMGLWQVVGAIISSVRSVVNFITGFRAYMGASGYGKNFHPQESFVRLYEHDKNKLGGGHRVKAIIMIDRWNEMLSDREQGSSIAPKEIAAYGQVYDYSMTEDGATISSGVAAYEPIIGGDENPFRKLVRTTEKVPLAPNKEYYTETPFGESFFPAPTVGYRKVKTTPVKITSENYNVNALVSNGTGYVEQEFYTAKEFPTRTSHTSIDPYREKSSDFNPLQIYAYDYLFGTQGYLIELNDMHGKAKSTKVMPDGDDNPISYVRYEYKTQASDPSRLDNRVPLVNRNLDIINNPDKEVGLSVDVVNDTRYSQSQSKSGGADVNIKITWVKGSPIIIPLFTLFPNISFDDTYFYSLTTTKVVNRYGVLVKTIAQENGQTITTENLAWDEQTGQVLLTKVENEFHDPLYSFTYPAYWAYQAMGFAYQNEGMQFTSLSAAKPNLIDGDEFICQTGSGTKYGYYDAYQDKFIDKDGATITGITWGQIVRSGARNMPMTPIGSISTRNNPIVNNKLNFPQAQVLNAGATEFKHLWKPFCNCGELSSTTPANPFTVGKRGQLRPWRSWTYLTERSQSITNGEVNIRQDGYFKDYTDFWKTTATYLDPYYRSASVESAKWQFVTQIENYNPLGMEIENKDALNRYSMAQYGYGRNLPIATSNNSQYRESGFDGFEDYMYGDCNDDHFSWRVRKNDNNYGLTENESHTGKRSFKVPPGGKSKIIKTIDKCPENQ